MEVKNNYHKEIESLFNTYYPALCSFAVTIVTEKSAAEDIVQEVFLALWDQQEDISSILKVKSYLYSSVRNKCLNYLKHQKVKQKHSNEQMFKADSESYFHDHIIEEETHRMIRSAIDTLPPKCKEVILLSLRGLKNAEIAEELNITINTIKTQKANAYKHLRLKLQDIFLLIPFFV